MHTTFGRRCTILSWYRAGKVSNLTSGGTGSSPFLHNMCQRPVSFIFHVAPELPSYLPAVESMLMARKS